VLPRIVRNLNGSVFGGNRLLMRMRVLPVGLTYRRKEEGKVGDLARESSRTTHPNVVCQEACAAWATCIERVVRTAAVAERMQEGLGMMKLDVLHHFALFVHHAGPAGCTCGQRTPACHASARSCSNGGALRRAPPLRASTAATAEDGITNPNTDADDLVEARALAVLPQDAVLPS
jgi:hypothetical protein